MRIGLFTDSYLPQVSGVATSIETLSDQLTKLGHQVFIFTTTDPHADPDNDQNNVIRLSSIPLISLAERRIVLKGVVAAYQVAQTYHLDIIHTQTEFGVGILGKLVARQLKIPVIHTLHTKYEDYVHYIAKGKILRPGMVKYIIKSYLFGVDGIIVPSAIVLDTVNRYGVNLEKRVIPTGIELDKFLRPEISAADCAELRTSLGILPDEAMLLSLSRIAEEKNIQSIIKSLGVGGQRLEPAAIDAAGRALDQQSGADLHDDPAGRGEALVAGHGRAGHAKTKCSAGRPIRPAAPARAAAACASTRGSSRSK